MPKLPRQPKPSHPPSRTPRILIGSAIPREFRVELYPSSPPCKPETTQPLLPDLPPPPKIRLLAGTLQQSSQADRPNESMLNHFTQARPSTVGQQENVPSTEPLRASRRRRNGGPRTTGLPAYYHDRIHAKRVCPSGHLLSR